MILLDEVRVLLERAGYSVASSSTNVLYFEDRSIFGFVAVFSTVDEILQEWKTQQDSFLRENAKRIREVSRKIWNAYSVFLTEEDCPPEKKSLLIAIEEDFQATRKIARGGLKSSSDVIGALLQLLPLQRSVKVEIENPLDRLRDRLQSFDEELLMFVEPKRSVEDIVAMLNEPNGENS